LFKGSERDLRAIDVSGVVHELRRDLITDPTELCRRLEEARRQYQIARHTHRRTLAQYIDEIARELAGSALVALPCDEEPDPTPDA
jgi:acetyl-CoA carboxylase alpha subunit